MKGLYNIMLYLTFAAIFILGALILIFPEEGVFLNCMIAFILFWPFQYIVKWIGIFSRIKLKKELNRVFSNRSEFLSKDDLIKKSSYKADIINKILGNKENYTKEDYAKFLKKIKSKYNDEWYSKAKSTDDHHNEYYKGDSIIEYLLRR